GRALGRLAGRRRSEDKRRSVFRAECPGRESQRRDLSGNAFGTLHCYRRVERVSPRFVRKYIIRALPRFVRKGGLSAQFSCPDGIVSADFLDLSRENLRP